MNRDKIVVVISDTHCGHDAGLTPPRFAHHQKTDDNRHEKFAILQDVTWRWFHQEAVRLRPVDVLVFNGDAIDGRGERSGSTELITADRRKQCKMALECIKIFQPHNVVLTFGTDYHTSSDGEEWESVMADKLEDWIEGDVAVGAHEWFNVNGIVFDCKHHLPMSGTPVCQFTALTRDAIWHLLWAARKEAPKADIILRSHVHTFLSCRTSDFAAFVTPGLQAYSKFGAKRVSRVIDYGFLHFDVSKEGNWKCHDHLARFAECRPTVPRY